MPFENLSSSQRDFQGMKVAIVTAAPPGDTKGGAERFYSGLLDGFRLIGCHPELIAMQASEPDFETITANYRKCRELDLSTYDLVVSTKVPTYAVKHPNHVLYLVHTVRVFDDMFDKTFDKRLDSHYVQRAKLHKIDFEALTGPKARFAIGHEVARRLYRWRGLDCQVLHPPLGFNGFRCGQTGDYFFLPGRLHAWKRVDLIIKALKGSRLPIKLVLAGVGEAEGYLRELAGNDARIQFLGRIDDDRLVQLYSDCLAVPFVPLREDYGYVTLEAFASGKPVLTCSDSGEPCQFVRDFETGLVVDPTPESIREGLEWFWSHREEACAMGQSAQRVTATMSWADTAFALATAGLKPRTGGLECINNVAVMDMQPIDPPVGGGRLRLLGLYHNLGEKTDCTYIGTYDWSGELYRSHKLSDTLREIDIPLSDAHHAAATALAAQSGGKVVIDLAFSRQAHMSPDFVSAVRQHLADANVAIFSHPWVYPLVKNRLRPDQVLIYDSQNVEGYLRGQLLDERNPVEADLLRQVVQDENDVGWAADWILACSHEDLLRFNRVYGFPLEKMRVIPNGVMAFNEPLPTPERRVFARKALSIDAAAFVAIFIGSPYGPNAQAAEFIAQKLAPIMPNVTFVIAGGVGQGLKSAQTNVCITGSLDESEKTLWLSASDIAINPMMSGSGTNIKMFDFMSMCLPVVTTSVGARGIDTGARTCMLVVEPSAQAFAQAISRLSDDTSARSAIGQEARQCVEDGYAWERISAQLGCFLESRKRLVGQPAPLFSVVVPTYERPDQLSKLLQCLEAQLERDFEVVVVDQSTRPWAEARESHLFPLTYFHSPVKGAVRARNTGATLAQGKIIAFIDDDCQPAEDWLLKARASFEDPDVVGVEGLIHSDHLNDAEWRPVTNVGFESIGFMTANLFVRSGAFQYLGGFDLQFDRPHFREDTDFGWRMMNLGKVPYAKDVKVFHPAQPRIKERESSLERAKFFQKDALLYRKHPEKYRQLFMAERHYRNTEGFRENLLAGFELHSIELPKWMSVVLN